MHQDEQEDTTLYKVVMYHEEQYSIWPAERILPLDWRDFTLGEDACRVRAGHAPHVLAAPRNCVAGLLRQDRATNIAARLRHHAWRPAHAVLRLLGISLSG